MTKTSNTFNFVKTAVSLLLAAILLISVVPTAFAGEYIAEGETLITVGGKTVTDDMGIEQVKRLFGTPKLETASVYGGKACTFYGSGYSNYLYIETNQRDHITSYGSVSKGFKTVRHRFGEKSEGLDYELADYDTQKLKGVIEFVWGAVSESGVDFKEKATDEAHIYMKAICRHSVEMFNAVSKLYGENTPVYYNDEVYDRCLQLNEVGTNVEDYAYSRSLDGYTYFMCSGICPESRITPLFFSKEALSRKIAPDKNAACFGLYKSFDSYKYRFINCCVNPELFKDRESVPLTKTEKERIKKMCQNYKASLAIKRPAEYFDVKPSFKSLPIVPGKVNDKLMQVAENYVNVIRTGAGLGKLKLDAALCEKAQAKAAYTQYLAENNIDNPSPHYPAKAKGVSDKFFKLCQPAAAENLFYGEITTGITHALDDRAGDSVWCGHRHNILGNFTKIGIGTSGSTSLYSQSVHEFSGSAKTVPDFTCWPSDGVTPALALQNPSFRWTVFSNSDYSFDADTYVKVKLLNNGKTWKFKKSDGSLKIRSNMLSFNDGKISVSAEQVYKVTLGNIKNKNGKKTTCSYRAVIADISGSVTPDDANVSLDTNELEMQKGAQRKLKVAAEGAGSDFNQLLDWESTDSSVAEVSKFGVVTAKKPGTAVITLKCGKNTKAKCAVTVRKAVPETTFVTEPTESSAITEPATAPTATVATKPATEPTTELANTQPDEPETVCEHAGDGGKIVKKATCVKNGKKIFTCTKCGKLLKTVVLKGTHKYVKYGKAKKATCFSKGHKQGKRCKYCGKVIKKAKTLPKKAVRMKPYQTDSEYVKIAWHKVRGARGYKLQYSTKANFRNSKTIKVKSTFKVFRKLKWDRYYYFRVKAIGKQGKKTVCSPWSEVCDVFVWAYDESETPYGIVYNQK